jgi:hypothetical protein
MKTEITPLVKLLFCNCLDLKALVVTEFKAIISFYLRLKLYSNDRYTFICRL